MRYLLPLLLTLLSCNDEQSLRTKPYDHVQCNKNTDSTVNNYKDFQGNEYSVYFEKNVNEYCMGPKFPKIVVTHKQKLYWVHVVELNAPYNYFKDYHKGWQWNISASESRWRFLDITPDARKNKSPFYAANTTTFHDNPLWGHLERSYPNSVREWVGHLFAFKTENMQEQDLVLSLKWGFTQKKDKNPPIAITPSLLEKSTWKKSFKDKFKAAL